MSAFSEIDMDRQEAREEQVDPMYLAALHELVKVEGAGRYAAVIDFTAKLFGKTPQQVLADTVTLG